MIDDGITIWSYNSIDFCQLIRFQSSFKINYPRVQEYFIILSNVQDISYEKCAFVKKSNDEYLNKIILQNWNQFLFVRTKSHLLFSFPADFFPDLKELKIKSLECNFVALIKLKVASTRLFSSFQHIYF